jgi:Flp pilus assembly pilin Flp
MSSAARTSLSRPRWQNALTQLVDDTGAVAIEYGLIAALIVLAILGTIIQIGESLFGLPLQLLVDAFEAALS